MAADDSVSMDIDITSPEGTGLSTRSDSDQDHGTKMDIDDQDDDGDDCSDPYTISQSRSKTMPIQASGSRCSRTTAINLDRLKNAKLLAEKAIKTRKIFMIQGPYPAIRQSLRERGWVEKFYRVNNAAKKSPRSKKIPQPTGDLEEENSDDDDDNDDDDDDCTVDPNDHGCKIPPWEEDNGLYGIMSRIVRNSSPTFIWSVRRDVVDPKALRKEQIINHFGKAGSFTTKVGLCVNMRNLTWFQEADPNTYFPRCYKLSQEDEKQAFIDDFRITSCINLLKHLKEGPNKPPEDSSEDLEKKQVVCTNPNCTKSQPNSSQTNDCAHVSSNSPRKGNGVMKKKAIYVPLRAVEIAMMRCERYLQCENHDDLDEEADAYHVSDSEWDEFLQWYYKVIHDGASIKHFESKMPQITNILKKLNESWSQYELDGTRNVWMLKAGAKSRGRGIVPYNRLEDLLKLVNFSVVQKEGKYVVQKYIERPLLLYNTKFDIRQWFLVTDWNPLTIWFYKDSYLRFCSQEYTLDKFDEAIHLSNNAIQKNYETSPSRSKHLPSDNMWHCDEFKDYLRRRGHASVWEDVIYPGMKNAVLGALLCSQDIVEYRKNSFELYGADFMLTEDLRPWLIEINCSPCMAASTKVTAKLCNAVLADTVKVVIDRKYDKNADIGRFELAHKQPYVHVPPYIGISLSVEGTMVKKPSWLAARKALPLNLPDPPLLDQSAKTNLSSTSTDDSDEPSSSEKGSGSSSRKAAKTVVIGRNNGTNDRLKSTVLQSTPVFSKSNQKLKRTRSRHSPAKHCNKSEENDEKVAEGQTLVVSSKSAEVVSLSTSKKDDSEVNVTKKSSKSKISIARPASEHLVPGCRINGKTWFRPNSARDIPAGSKEGRVALHLTRCSSTFEHKGMEDDDLGNKLINLVCSPNASVTALISPATNQAKLSKRRENVEKPTLTSLQNEHLTVVGGGNSQHKICAEKQLLQMKHAETVDIQAMHNDASSKGYVMTTPWVDSIWGRTCNRCGNGMNLKLDYSRTSPCQCQQDSLCLGTDNQWYHRSVPLCRSGNNLQMPFAVTVAFPQQSYLPQPPSQLPKPTILNRIHIDKNKQPSLFYTKADNSSQSETIGLRKPNKFVLKYLDADTPKPEITTKHFTKPYPKLVSRYIGKRVNKDGVPICVDTYKQGKLAVITHSFDKTTRDELNAAFSLPVIKSKYILSSTGASKNSGKGWLQICKGKLVDQERFK